MRKRQLVQTAFKFKQTQLPLLFTHQLSFSSSCCKPNYLF